MLLILLAANTAALAIANVVFLKIVGLDLGEPSVRWLIAPCVLLAPFMSAYFVYLSVRLLLSDAGKRGGGNDGRGDGKTDGKDRRERA